MIANLKIVHVQRLLELVKWIGAPIKNVNQGIRAEVMLKLYSIFAIKIVSLLVLKFFGKIDSRKIELKNCFSRFNSLLGVYYPDFLVILFSNRRSSTDRE